MAVVTDIPFALCGKLRVEWRVGESPVGIVVSYGRSGEKGGVARRNSGELRAGWGERREPPVRIVVSYGRGGEKGGNRP